MSQIERNRLETYVEQIDGEDTDGMSLQVRNVEGGGESTPDESSFYKRRYQWLKETNGGKHDIWRHLAKNEYKGKSFDSDDKQLVFVEIPGWFISDDDDFSSMFPNIHNGNTVRTFAELKIESSKDSEAYAIGQMYSDTRNMWLTPRNMYSTAWVPKKCCTVYISEGEPRPVDKEKIRPKDALKDDVDVFEAEEDDYDWRLALGAAYRRSEGEERSDLSRAHEDAKELPNKLYKKVEVGVDEYMRQKEARNEDVSDEELAMVIRSLTESLTPGSVKNGSL